MQNGMVWKARSYLKSDPYAAKSWLITARTLFPKSFTIQYEAYSIEKSWKNAKDAAKLLEEIFSNFPQDPQLWSEVHCLLDALQTDSNDASSQFHRDLFAAIPTTLQCHMLLRIADNTSNILEQCRLLLLVLRRYPEQVYEHGIKLIDSLLATEKKAQSHNPVNCYRKYLVHDVVSLVLKTPPGELLHKHIYRWLQKSIEFYICYVTQPPSGEPLLSPVADLTSPTKKVAALYSVGSGRRPSIAGLNEKDGYVSHPMESLYDTVMLVAEQFGWDLGDFTSKKSADSRWQELYGLYQRDPSANHKQVLYCGTILFLECLYHYASRMDSEQFAVNVSGSGHDPPIVLIEGFKADVQLREPRAKKRKTNESGGVPQLHASKSISNSQLVIQNFTTALKCWELLHASDTMDKVKIKADDTDHQSVLAGLRGQGLNLITVDFSKLLQHWKADGWAWLHSFEVDMLIYQGYFREAVSRLQSIKITAKNQSTIMRTDLQMACCHYCLGCPSKASEIALNVISALPPTSQVTEVVMSLPGAGRQLQMLSCTDLEILPYCIQLMLTCFKEKAFASKAADDMALGHMLVLLQHDWPKHESLFTQAIEKISRQGTFTYNLFFNYIVNIDILEEFAYLRTPDGGKVNLDILSTSTKAIAQQRTVTRGVNKGVKEDFRTAMEKQVHRSTENVETVIRQFLMEERDLLQQNLL